jgi:hypothetical protein
MSAPPLTDERIVDIATAMLAETCAAVSAEQRRMGAEPDDAVLVQVVGRVVRNTLEMFRREERSLDERQLGVLLVSVLTITVTALRTMHAGIGATLLLAQARADSGEPSP